MTRQSIVLAKNDGPPETGFTRFRAFLVRKSDKSDLRWSSPRVTQSWRNDERRDSAALLLVRITALR
jgi:hypothetical protein